MVEWSLGWFLPELYPISNYANQDGGGLYASDIQITIINGSFYNNSANWSGGAMDLDFSFEIEGLARFRASFLHEMDNPGLVLRVIKTNIPDFCLK